jgi:hypothetical protein
MVLLGAQKLKRYKDERDDQAVMKCSEGGGIDGQCGAGENYINGLLFCRRRCEDRVPVCGVRSGRLGAHAHVITLSEGCTQL